MQSAPNTCVRMHIASWAFFHEADKSHIHQNDCGRLMGKSIPVRVGDQVFKNKQNLIAYMQELMARYSVGDSLSDTDRFFCFGLFAWHSEADRKRVNEIIRIDVRLDIFGNKHLQIFRQDGTDEDISWRHCVTNATATT